MAIYDLGTIGLTVQSTGAQQATQEVQKLGAAAQKVMDDFKRMQAVLALAKKGTDDAATSFRRLSVTELQQASKQMRGFEAALANTRRGMGQMGMATQQIGYQVGDFLVQIQSGTNFMVAFGQQATQLVGILPAFSKQLGMSVGRLIGISSVLGIVIPLATAFGAAWMRTSESVKEGADKQKQAYDSVKQSIESLQLARQMGASGAQTQSEQSVLNTLNAALEERQRLLEESLALEYASTNEASLQEAAARAELSEKQRANRLAILENEELLKSLGYQRELDIAAKRRANEKRDEYRQALALRIEEEKAEELARRKKDAFHAMAGEMGAVSSSMYEANNGAREILGNLVGATNAAMSLRDALGGVSAAASSRASQISVLTAEINAAKSGKSVSGAGAAAQTALGLAGSGATLDQIAAASATAAEQAARIEALQKEKSSLLNPSKSGGGAERIKKETEAVKELTAAEKERQTILKSIESSLEAGFMSMIDGTKSVKDAFKSMAREILKELYRVLVVQRMVGAISGAVNMLTLPAGPSTGTLGLPKFATGGSMMPGKSYLVGENGPELVIPRHSGTVVNANQTANAAGGNGTTVVNNNISVTGSDAAMVRAEVAKMIPQITNATKAAVIDAKQRGGQMAAAFR
jgi:hypothetical protein